jgi:hypothetical protein
MGERVIDQGRPKQNENDKGAEFCALGKRAGYQSRRNDREHHLVDHESLMGNRSSVIGVGFRSHAVQADPIQAAYEPTDIGAKGQAVAKQYPLNSDEGDDDKTLHDSPKGVLSSNQSTIKQKEPRNGHH